MKKICPISSIQIDTNLVRINTFLVALLASLYLYFHLTIIAMLLFLDFSIRVFGSAKYSYLFTFAKLIQKIFKIKEQKTDAAPKRFAAFFGLIFSFVIFIASFFGLSKVAFTTTIVLLICALLEAVFNYCLGCQIYYIYQAIRFKI